MMYVIFVPQSINVQLLAQNGRDIPLGPVNRATRYLNRPVDEHRLG